MADLTIASLPDNMRANKFGMLVEHDVFDICNRIKELDANLLIYVMDEGAKNKFSIVEVGRDGHEYFCFNTDELDARVIEKVRYLLHVPFQQRFAEAEKLELKSKEENKQTELDQLYERIGAPMLRDLERTGFIQRPRSYAKRGIKFA